MTRLLVIAALVCTSFVAGHAQAQFSSYDTDYKAHCADLFPTDFATQKFCQDQNVSARRQLDRIWSLLDALPSGTQKRDLQDTFDHCADLFLPDFSTAEFCYGQNENAWEDVTSFYSAPPVPTNVAQAIRSQCSIFDADYSTMLFCINQQVDAWRSLQ